MTKFLVVDADNNILYAAPLEGSAKAFLVNDPLPIEFSVQDKQTTSLTVQVVETEGAIPADFGYVPFSFEVVTYDNLFKNGNFDDESFWDDFVCNNGEASMEIVNGEAKITITNPGSNAWDVGVAQIDINLEADCIYELKFDARADTNITISSRFQLQGGDWTAYNSNLYDITPVMTTYTHKFIMNFSVRNQRILLYIRRI